MWHFANTHSKLRAMKKIGNTMIKMMKHETYGKVHITFLNHLLHAQWFM